jgi:hypothetical protein
MASGLRAFCIKLGVPAEVAANPGEIDQPLLDRMWQVITNDRNCGGPLSSADSG